MVRVVRRKTLRIPGMRSLAACSRLSSSRSPRPPPRYAPEIANAPTSAVQSSKKGVTSPHPITAPLRSITCTANGSKEYPPPNVSDRVTQ
eukprot:1193882-Prorocentrum_minimum.AAC.2